MKYFFVFPKQLLAALILAGISSFVVCGLSKVFHKFPDQLYLHCLHSLACIVFFSCVFLGRLSHFLSSDCLNVSSLFLLKGATSLTDLKFVRSSPSTSIPSETSAFLKTSSKTEVNSSGESGSPCLTPMSIGISSDTNLSKWILATAWL